MEQMEIQNPLKMFHLHLKMSAGCSFITWLKLIQHIQQSINLSSGKVPHRLVCLVPLGLHQISASSWRTLDSFQLGRSQREYILSFNGGHLFLFRSRLNDLAAAFGRFMLQSTIRTKAEFTHGNKMRAQRQMCTLTIDIRCKGRCVNTTQKHAQPINYCCYSVSQSIQGLYVYQ